MSSICGTYSKLLNYNLYRFQLKNAAKHMDQLVGADVKINFH